MLINRFMMIHIYEHVYKSDVPYLLPFLVPVFNEHIQMKKKRAFKPTILQTPVSSCDGCNSSRSLQHQHPEHPGGYT